MAGCPGERHSWRPLVAHVLRGLDFRVFGGHAHALQRMFERAIRPATIRGLLRFGEVIAEYPDDRPFPSQLILGRVAGQPIHVVAAVNAANRRCHIITVCRPNPELWDGTYRRRRR